ncbi:Dicer-like protein 1 [Fusarium venenatum]|uniref:Dicer-like protein 1 n=1 Tax=Fusarium venenatum TaxID=56646 RepID=A0A2L2TA68_9HYPO|nr:uncharacterized protein FVRRES_13819 [Fusarium venenatum]KAG8350040.1 Dicer-like protein 1 [Fusarium venenatum]CEI41950.1 unnamed protein product [Fusarium venenatum]
MDNDSTDSEDEIVQYRLTVRPSKPRKITERKRRNQQILDAFAREAHPEKPRQEETINAPRDYQTELFEKAKEKNLIVVLPTSSGKTFIAVLLLRHYLREEVESCALGNPRKVAFFLVEKVALCEQQHRVLDNHLGGHSTAIFTGDTTALKKDKKYWDTQFASNMVVVCTADILLDCLNNAFITMERINLLIFDEAHHAKKKHSYAEIMRRYYYSTDKTKRPRIFGMTASPVDSRAGDVVELTLELEKTLDSEIATLSDKNMKDLAKFQVHVEETVKYDTLGLPDETKTQLWESVSKLVSRNKEFKASLDFTKEASSILGPWCADRYWQISIDEIEIRRLADRTRLAFFGTGEKVLARAEKAVETVKEVQKLVAAHEFGTISPESQKLSNKVKCLHKILVHAFTTDFTQRCIVFVDQRYTACLLSDLYNQASMAIPGMNASYMVGHQSSGTNLGNMTLRKQCSTLKNFRDGITNCLFATSVAEEGIDVPDCDLVIRFDLYNSVIQYIQSKGRARHKSSRYITMLEDGNIKQIRSLKQAARDATALREFCMRLPSERKLQDDVFDEETEKQIQQIHYNVYELSDTGARLTFPSSLQILSRFISSLGTAENGFSKAEYYIYREGTFFTAAVNLPPSSPIITQIGFPQRSKLLAKCSAAFETCIKLIKGKHIDHHLQPTFVKRAHAMRNARVGISPNKKAEHDMRLRPNIWSIRGEWTQFFPTKIYLGGENGGEDRPLILLSRSPLPGLPSIPLFLGNGRSAIVKVACFQEPLDITTKKAEGLTTFTFKLFADIFSKEFEATCDQFPYLLAPSAKDTNLGQIPQIDWDTVYFVKDHDTLEWENAPDEFFMDKLVVDPYDGGRKLILKGIDKSKKPSDPTPDGVPESRSRAYRTVEQTIKQYSNSLFAKSRLAAQWRDDQPVVKAELLSLRRNLLDEFQVDEQINKDCFVILEPLNVSPIPMDVVSMALKFPAIIHRIDSALIALDACELFDLSIPPTLALEAMTKDSDNTEDHGKQQINFQAGMGSNYERLEFLGDSFLKMATTIAIFVLKPKSNECIYHVERMLLICNNNLFNTAVDCKLPEYIRSLAFDRRTWYPDLTLRKGKALKTTTRQRLADKSIADVCEALIGAAYLSSKDDNLNMAVKAVTRMCNAKHHTMLAYDEYYASFKVPGWQKAKSNANQRRLVQKVADAIGYEFKSAPLLQSAFTHPSYTYSGDVPNYQRLEFLGDALIDMAIVDHLYHKFPLADPQWLTEHKMAMASNQFFGCLCVKLNLHHHLLFNTSQFLKAIRDYVLELKMAEETAREEADEEGTPMRMDFWINATPPPKAYADSIEALIGAMFVDSQFDYSVVERFFTKLILPYFEDMSLYDTFAKKHPYTRLTKMMQQEIGCMNFTMVSEPIVPEVERGMAVLKESDMMTGFLVHQKIITSHVSKSGRYSKIAAAKEALKMLEEYGGDVVAIKKMFGCNCDSKAMKMDGIGHGTAV